MWTFRPSSRVLSWIAQDSFSRLPFFRVWAFGPSGREGGGGRPLLYWLPTDFSQVWLRTNFELCSPRVYITSDYHFRPTQLRNRKYLLHHPVCDDIFARVYLIDSSRTTLIIVWGPDPTPYTTWMGYCRPWSAMCRSPGYFTMRIFICEKSIYFHFTNGFAKGTVNPDCHHWKFWPVTFDSMS